MSTCTHQEKTDSLSFNGFFPKKAECNHPVVDYLTVSVAAKTKLLEQMSQKTDPIPDGIRISTPTRGCSGLTYKMDYAYYGVNITPKDELLDLQEVKLFIAPESIFVVFGCAITFEDNGVECGFVFENPNEKSKCGCGASFKV